MKKIWMTICTLTLGLALLSGCGQQTTTAEPIGIDAAKTLALEDAGISADAASFTTAGLDRRGDTEYYEVDFTANGETYEYEIDAITGVIIEKQIPGGQTATDDTAQTAGTTTGTQSGTQTSGDVIGEEAARKAALDHAGLAESEVTFIRSHLDWDDGRQVYDVEFYTSDYTEYDYEIDAATGEILSYDYDAEGYSYQPNATPGTAITAEQARAIALAEVPGAAESDIYEFETDRDDGRLEYEGKIIYNNTEYEFTIDGYSGAIREWDAEPFHR